MSANSRGLHPQNLDQEILQFAESPPINDQDYLDLLFLLRCSKLEFPKYNGDVNPITWLYRCDSFFDVHKVSNKNRVIMARLSLEEDTQLRYQTLKQDQPVITWEELWKKSISDLVL